MGTEIEGLAAGFELAEMVRYGKENSPLDVAMSVAELDEDTARALLLLALSVLCDDRLDEAWEMWGGPGPEEVASGG